MGFQNGGRGDVDASLDHVIRLWRTWRRRDGESARPRRGARCRTACTGAIIAWYMASRGSERPIEHVTVTSTPDSWDRILSADIPRQRAEAGERKAKLHTYQVAGDE